MASKSDVVKKVSEYTGASARDCDKIITGLVETVKDLILDGERVSFPGFATFEVVERAARRGRNPKTGEVAEYPAHSVVRCRISPSLNKLLG